MVNEFSELFDKKQKELSPEQFKFWLCGAYGVFESHILSHRTKPKEVLISLKTCIDV